MRLPLVLLIVPLLGCPSEPLDGDDDDATEPQDPVWQEFLEVRQDHLRALSEPILDCVGQQDTGHPAFHGCIDWHSAVHATFSLLALSRLTDDATFAAAADAVLDPDSVAGELALLQAGGPFPGELPYGYAWFLVLARERERAGWTDLLPLAGVVANDLAQYISDLPPDVFAADLIDDDYQNLAWALLNLWLQARWDGDAQRQAWVEDLVRHEVLPRADACPLSSSADNVFDFFPPCLHQARLLVEVLPVADADAWLADALPADWELPPLTDAPSPHVAGLNFSRTWGLYTLWRATDDALLRDAYIDHVDAMMLRPELWAEDYWSYSHWVAQFGVYGLALTADELP